MAETARATKRADPLWRRVLTPTGLALATSGVFLALWAFTGDRALDLTYFWWAMAGVALVLVGIAAAALGRALAPRGRAVRRAPPVRTSPVPKAFPNARPSDTPAHALLRCPDCSTTFALAAGTGPVVCPGCGAEGDRPLEAA